MSSLFIFMAALFTSLALVPVLRRWALTTGTVDTPDERKVHKKAIPRLGGVAVYLCFLFASLVFIDASREVRGILAGGLVVFITGLIDDLYGLSPKKKFVGEIAAVVVTMLVSHLYLENLGDLFGFGPVVLVPWLAVPFTIFAVVGVINAINLIDGLDGLSGGISVIALAAFMVLSFHDGNKEVLALSAALLGSVIGFLKYNLYPARIFMGDAGSLSVGFVLGFLAVFLTQSPLSSVSPMTPVVILGLPIIDAIWVMVRRVMKGNKPFTPDMTHLHHKFLNLGFQHRFTVIVIYGISLFWVLVAITVREWPEYLLLLSYVVVSMLFYGLLRYFIDHREKYTFFAKDSSEGLRESYTYRMLAAKADYAKPLLFALLIGYFSLTIIVGISEDVSSIKMGLFYVPGLVIVGSFRKRLRTSVVKAFFYLSALVAAFIIDQASNIDLWLGVDLAQIEILIFVLILTLVVIKSVFRLEGELYVSLPEIVVLAAGVFALVAFSQIDELSYLSNVPIRGGVLFLAINLVFFYRGRSVE